MSRSWLCREAHSIIRQLLHYYLSPYWRATSGTSVSTQIMWGVALVKMQILIKEVWEGAQESAFLPSSQVMSVQVAHCLHIQ